MEDGFASQDHVHVPVRRQIATAAGGVKVECSVDADTKAKLDELASSYGNVKKVLLAAEKVWNRIDQTKLTGNLAKSVYGDMTHLHRTSATEWCESGSAI